MTKNILKVETANRESYSGSQEFSPVLILFIFEKSLFLRV